MDILRFLRAICAGTTLTVAAATLAAAPASVGATTGDVAAASTAAASAAEPVPPGSCADVLFIGARGSGQKAGGHLDGLGPQIAGVLDRLEQGLDSERSIDAVAVDYETPGLGVVFTSRKGLTKYLAGIGDGIANVMGLLTEKAAACPEQRVVLAGFSQGAMVMHQVVRRLVRDDVPEILDRIAGVALLGDGDREKKTKVRRYGNAPKKGWGLRRPLKNQPIPQQLAKRTHSLCVKRDIVCNTSNYLAGKLKKQNVAKRALVNALLSLDVRKLARGKRVHSGPAYRAGSPILQQAVDGIVDTILRWPVPEPVDLELAGFIDTPVDHQLEVSVHPDLIGQVEWYDVAGLPPGLSLSPTGVLTGSPAEAGGWTTTYRVRGIGSTGVHASGVQGTISWVVQSPGKRIAAGLDHVCRITDDATWCWGKNWYGQLGDDTTADADEPALVAGGHTFSTIAGGSEHTCAVDSVGSAWCWGRDNKGQLGNGHVPTDSLVPAPVSGDHTFTRITAGLEHTCALDARGRAWCWGRNTEGQLGDLNVLVEAPTPIQVTGDHTFTALEAGYSHTCGIDTELQAWCWGSNSDWQIGDDGDLGGRLVPVAVAGDHDFVQIDPGQLHTCALDTEGKAWCWGDNFGGQLGAGDPPVSDQAAPIAVVDDHEFTDLAADLYQTCGIDTESNAWCWGLNSSGELGINSFDNWSFSPVAVHGGNAYDTIVSGRHFNCAVATDDETWCWGENGFGQIGVGSTDDQPVPVHVEIPELP